MALTIDAIPIHEFTPEERIRLIERLWESLEGETLTPPDWLLRKSAGGMKRRSPTLNREFLGKKSRHDGSVSDDDPCHHRV